MSKSQSIPVPLKWFDYDKEKKCLSISSEPFGMPARFSVQSEITGRVMEFIPLTEDDPMFDQDQWDGEMQIYRPVEFLKNVDYLVISHQW